MHKITTYTRSYSQAFSYTHIHEDIQWIYALTDVCLPGFIHFSLMMEAPLDASINFASINQRLCFFLAWFKSNCRRLQTFHAGVIGQCHLGDRGKAIKMLFWIVLVLYKQFMLYQMSIQLCSNLQHSVKSYSDYCNIAVVSLFALFVTFWCLYMQFVKGLKGRTDIQTKRQKRKKEKKTTRQKQILTVKALGDQMDTLRDSIVFID